ncbi:MAG: 4-hydroxythreonine-4-phosphate dehydrogenase PdxA [Pseudomonadota bacterium]|jgi:4-hydroxythreonine-4-phosphate dehydrogenase
MNNLIRIALTAGEPAGIGLDVTLQWAMSAQPVDIIVFSDPVALQARADLLGLSIHLDVREYHAPAPHQAGILKVRPYFTAQPVTVGRLNPANAPYVLHCLEQACRSCQRGEFDAMVTAPVHKGVINDAGITFSGHTEFLAALTHARCVVMMLATSHLKVALVTTHIPLAQVSKAVTRERLEQTVRVLERDLRRFFGIEKPRIAVCGLNPHAGENGHLGREEIDVINPVLEKLRNKGFHLIGAISADTAFTEKSLSSVDAVLTMYHDQGLPVLKQQGFGEAVNITLGLPIIRTSVDHGTALELAGTGNSNAGSLTQAIEIAAQMAKYHHATQTS